MAHHRREPHTTVCCAHPYFGFVSMPRARIDFSDRVPAEFGHGAVATIDGQGFRNDGVPATKPPDEFWIGIFGGSVAFGVPATSNDWTIAGCLERRLNEGPRPAGKRVRVLNLAIPGGQQPQQLLVLQLNGHQLDGAITFDGVNEVVVPAFYNKDAVPDAFPYRPYYELLYGRAMSDDQICETVLAERSAAAFSRRPRWQRRLLKGFHAREMVRRRTSLLAAAVPVDFQSIFGSSRDVPAEMVAARGAQNWSDCTTLMHAVCRQRQIECLFVVQPVPDRMKALTNDERAYLLQSPEITALRAKGYERVLAFAPRLAAAGLPVMSFEDVFAARTDAIYTDLVHFEDRGSRIVATRMAESISRAWSGFAA